MLDKLLIASVLRTVKEDPQFKIKVAGTYPFYFRNKWVQEKLHDLIIYTKDTFEFAMSLIENCSIDFDIQLQLSTIGKESYFISTDYNSDLHIHILPESLCPANDWVLLDKYNIQVEDKVTLLVNLLKKLQGDIEYAQQELLELILLLKYCDIDLVDQDITEIIQMISHIDWFNNESKAFLCRHKVNVSKAMDLINNFRRGLPNCKYYSWSYKKKDWIPR